MCNHICNMRSYTRILVVLGGRACTRKLENRRYACCTRQDHWPRYAVWHNTKHCMYTWTSADTVHCAHTHIHTHTYTHVRVTVLPYVTTCTSTELARSLDSGCDPQQLSYYPMHAAHTNVFKEIITRTLYAKKKSLTSIRTLIIGGRVSTITR